MYEERMLQVADFLVEIEVTSVTYKVKNIWLNTMWPLKKADNPLPPQMYEVALWQGYSLHLFQFSPLKITQVADVDQFMASFFPEGLDADQDTFTLKVPHGYTDFVFHVCVAALSRRCVYV